MLAADWKNARRSVMHDGIKEFQMRQYLFAAQVIRRILHVVASCMALQFDLRSGVICWDTLRGTGGCYFLCKRERSLHMVGIRVPDVSPDWIACTWGRCCRPVIPWHAFCILNCSIKCNR